LRQAHGNTPAIVVTLDVRVGDKSAVSNGGQSLSALPDKQTVSVSIGMSQTCRIWTSRHDAHLDQFEKPPQQVATTAIAVGACCGRQPPIMRMAQGLSGVRALRSGALEICIKPANG
jgi:hypothetical protein